MKLCRFELLDGPAGVRSGIYADRVYETHGLSGVGIHEPSKVRILTPTGQLTSVRFWQSGDCTFLNPTGMLGPLAEFDFPSNTKALDVEIRPGVIVRDVGERLDAEEAASLVLGYTILLNFVARDLLVAAPGRARSFPIVVGPFITTPEDLDPLALGAGKDLSYAWSGKLSVNGQPQADSPQPLTSGFAQALELSSQGNAVTSADLIAIESLDFPSMDKLPLGRFLQPGDTVQAVIEPLGTLVVRIV